jgi:hypothetical protein
MDEMNRSVHLHTVMTSNTVYACLFCDIFSLSDKLAAFSITWARQVGPPNFRLLTALTYVSWTDWNVKKILRENCTIQLIVPNIVLHLRILWLNTICETNIYIYIFLI